MSDAIRVSGRIKQNIWPPGRFVRVLETSLPIQLGGRQAVLSYRASALC